MKNTAEVKSFYVYVRTSCPRRSLDASKLYRYFVENNLKPVDDPKNADLIVIYTCGGFNYSEELSILTIENSLKTSAKVVITGCLPKINPARLRTYGKALLMPTENLGQLDSLIRAKVPYSHGPNPSISCGVNDLYRGSFFQRFKRNIGFSFDSLRVGNTYVKKKTLHQPKYSQLSQEQYKLEIARGCLGSCSYCAIKKGMEKFHSFPEEQIIGNFKSGLKEGYRDFALIAGDIGCYGVDIETNLPNLLKKLFAVDGDYKLILVDLNARWLVKYYADLLSILKVNVAKVSRIIIPVQSGSDRILKLMNRYYAIEDVKKCLLDLQKNIPTLMLETHIMVGFPGETTEDFQKTAELIREIKFADIQLYKYEDRPGTTSSMLPDKVGKRTILKRAKILAKEANVTYAF